MPPSPLCLPSPFFARMAAPLNMDGFRSLERHEQVRALADAEFLSMAVTKNYTAQDYDQ